MKRSVGCHCPTASSSGSSGSSCEGLCLCLSTLPILHRGPLPSGSQAQPPLWGNIYRHALPWTPVPGGQSCCLGPLATPPGLPATLAALLLQGRKGGLA